MQKLNKPGGLGALDLGNSLYLCHEHERCDLAGLDAGKMVAAPLMQTGLLMVG